MAGEYETYSIMCDKCVFFDSMINVCDIYLAIFGIHVYVICTPRIVYMVSVNRLCTTSV